MGNLSNLYVSQSFQSLIHLGTNSVATSSLTTLQDGYGNSIGIEVNTAGDLFLSGSLTASLQQGYVWVGNSNGKTTTVPTSSFGGGGTINTGSLLVTASVTNDDITFTKGDGSQFTIQVATGSFALSSSYAQFAESASYAQFATDIYLTVKNTTGAQLNKGTVVRIIGATGDNALIATASWTNDANSANTLGFLYENIANDSFGKVITQGTLLGINTNPALGYTAGQILYLSSSGQYTNVKPPAPYHEVRLGQVLRAQLNNGSVYVLIQNGYELEELHDVDINTGSLANNNLLAYNSATSQWENKTLTEVGAATTGSNTFTGQQNIQNTLVIEEAGNPLIYTQFIEDTLTNKLQVSQAGASGIDFNTNVEMNELTASLQQGYVWVGDSLNKTILVPTSSFGGGGSINTGSFATTGSNSFNGDQNVTGSVRVSQQLQIGSTNLGPTIQSLDSGTPAGFTGLQVNAGESGSFSMRTLYGGGIASATLEAYNTFPSFNTGGKISAKSGGGIDVLGYGADVIISGSNTTLQGLRYPNTDGTNGQVITTNGSGVLTFTTVSGGSINTGSFATTGSNVFIGNQTISGSLDIQNTLTASLQQGYVWVGDASGRTTTVATSSFGGGGSLPSGLLSSSVTNFTDYSASVDTRINNIVAGTGFATTGSNTFTGDQIITGSTSITGALSITPVIAPNSAPGGIGQFIIPFLSGSNNVFARDQDNALYWQPAFNILAVSSSAGNTTMGVSGISVNSSTTGSTSLASTRVTSNFGAGRNIAIAGDAAGTALSGLTGVTNPSIILQSGSVGFPLQYYAPIQFQSSQSFTDGRVTFTRPLIAQQGAEITGSLTVSSSAATDFTVVGAMVVTGSTAAARTTITSGSVTVTNSPFFSLLTPGNAAFSGFGGTQFQQIALENDEGTVVLSIDSNGSYIRDYNPTLGDYSNAIKFQPYSNYGVGQVQVLRSLEVTGSLGISGNLTSSLQQGYVWVGDASGRTTTVATSSFGGGGATFPFTGDAVITGSLLVSGSATNDLTVIGNIMVTGSSTIVTNTNGVNGEYFGTSFGGNVGVYNVSNFTEIGLALDGAQWTGNWANGPILYVNNTPGDTYDGVFGFQNKTNYTDGRITALKPLDIRGNTTITGSLTQSGSVTIQGNTTFLNRSGDTTNVILGNNAMNNITGNVTSNVAIGAGAMRYASGSTQCVALGANALGITTGSNNFAIGAETLASNTTGNQNVAIGVGALNNNKTGNLNTSIGNDSGFRNVSGSRNVYIGPNAGNDHYGDNTVMVGGYSGGGQVLNSNIILSDGQGNIKAQYNGSGWSLQEEIRLNKGSNKPTDIVSVNNSLTVSNSLVTTNSIILVTTQNGSVGGVEYPAVVTNKGAGTFDIVHNYAGNLDVAYLIINPT